MNRHFVLLYWSALRKALERMRFAAMVMTFVVSFLLLVLADLSADDGTLNVSKAALLGVSGSIFAASAFLFLQSLVDAISGTAENVYHTYYRDLADRCGLKSLFSQRGGDDVISLYSSLISRARSRVWAVGMTNRHFLLQHKDALIEVLRSHQVDVRISFWDPTAAIQCNGEQQTLIGLQDRAETGRLHSSSDWNRVITDRQRAFAGEIAAAGSLRGHVRIFNTRSPAAFSCLLVDDDLFFFPFLAMLESTNHPTIRCDAMTGIGKDITQHVSLLLATELLSTVVYHRHENEDCVNRLQ